MKQDGIEDVTRAVIAMLCEREDSTIDAVAGCITVACILTANFCGMTGADTAGGVATMKEAIDAFFAQRYDA